MTSFMVSFLKAREMAVDAGGVDRLDRIGWAK
jgi:hypothetical protein